MSKKSNPALIGGFVVGAVALAAVGISLFGGSELLQSKQQYVTYFDTSLKGLRVGANVLFRGVRVGYVEDISLVGDADTLEFVAPVTIRILPETLTVTRGGRVLGKDERVVLRLDDMVEAGLRSQLGVESFVTGQLLVELDFRPDTEAVYRGINPAYPEIPSVTSNIQQVLASLQGWFSELSDTVDVAQVGRDLQSILSGVDKLVNSPDLQSALSGLNRLVSSEDTQSLSGDLRRVIGELRGSVAEARELIRHVDERVEPIAGNLAQSLENLDATLAAGQDALSLAKEQIRGDSELAVEFVDSLREVKDAARSLRIFLDYIERNPESLLRGKRPPKE